MNKNIDENDYRFCELAYVIAEATRRPVGFSLIARGAEVRMPLHLSSEIRNNGCKDQVRAAFGHCAMLACLISN
jgi:hypothetical protein